MESNKFFQASVRRGRIIWYVIAIVIIAAAAGAIDHPTLFNQGISFVNAKTGIGLPSVPEKPFRLGLDLQGGTQLIYESDLSKVTEEDKGQAMEGVRDVIERRVNAFGVSEPDIRIAGDSKDRLNIELAGILDVKQAIELIGKTPLLEFKEQDESAADNGSEGEDTTLIDTIRKKAEEVLVKANAQDADFGKLAEELSEDPGSKAGGGDLGYFKRGVMVPEFEKAVFDELKIGEVSKKLTETQFGFHIIKKEDSRTAEDGGEEVRARHILIAKPAPDLSKNWKNTELNGSHVIDAKVVRDSQVGEIQVSLTFNNEGEKLFEEITGRNVGKPVGIFLDGIPISTPVVQQQISGGSAVITGNFGMEEARELSRNIRAGALPVPISLISQHTVGPTLGKASLDASLKAGIWGLLFIVAFMIFYYRLPGAVASLSLLFYGLAVLAIFKLWPVTLTLSGIAGFILSIGMAVDANVLIFSRLREELALGKPHLSALDDAFSRAWPSIRDGNVSTLITCFVLIQFSTSVVKGFAITLSIGILVSMISAIFVTKKFLELISIWPTLRRSWLY